MNYTCYDIFMIRTPALPINIATDLDEINDYDAILNYLIENKLDNYFKEALQISSYSLYNALHRIGKDRKKDREAYISLYKYLQRASTRATPYGLLANVALGSFSDIEAPIINLNTITKKIKVDNLWAFNLIKNIEKDYEVLKELSLTWNKSCYISDKRVRNPHFSNYGIAQINVPKENSSIRNTNLIKVIKDNAGEFIFYKDLLQVIHCKYPDVNQEKICDAINTLVEQEYLFTNLRIPTYCEDVLGHIISTLDKSNVLPELKKELFKVKYFFNQYDKVGTEKAEFFLNKIYGNMKKISSGDNYLEVNSGSLLQHPYLCHNVKQKLEKFVKVIATIGMESEVYSCLNEFKKQFYEEYGNNIEVPLTEIINPSGFDGLKYCNEVKYRNTDREHKIKEIIDRKVQEALINGEDKVILIQDNFIGISGENISNFRYPDSFDMNFVITKRGKELRLSISPNCGSTAAGKTFQRFDDVFDKEQFEKYNEIYDKIIEGKEYIQVEMREMPNSGRVSNIINSKKNYKYFLTIGMTDVKNDPSEILLTDLVIGSTTNGNLYIKSISKNIICKMVTDNMLNPMLNSKLFNLLRGISSEYEDIKVVDRLGDLLENKYTYTPEIIIEDVTVLPKRWIFTEQHLNGESFQKFKENFEYCYKRYLIDEYIYMCKMDQRLLLHMNNQISLEILYQEFKGKKYLELCSLEKNLLNNNVVKNLKNESYASEFVFSFYVRDNKKLEIPNNEVLIQSSNRVIPPFEQGWIYLKLFYNDEMENDILKELLNSKEELNVNRFFFLRYADESGEHIRLRIKYHSQEEALKSFNYLNQWLQNMRNFGMLKTWSLHEYRRENNRYGGENIISKIEELFFKDSEYVINIINNNDMSSEEKMDDVYFNAVSTLLFSLALDKKVMFEVLNKVVTQQSHRKEYSEKRKKYMKALEDILYSEAYVNDSRTNTANVISTVIFDEKQRLTNSVDDIILSLLHMCCNRLSRNRMLEEKTYSILRHTLYDVITKEKFQS